ncbi:MAG: ribonuclease D [Nevskia sp.]
MNSAVELITDPAALADRVQAWKQRPWLALDTEFLREDTYHPILCLVQVGDGETDVCIDTLALKGAPLTPLWDLLATPGMSKVVHAASQDLEIFIHLGHGTITPMFDTQVAAALLGYGDQLGYAGLVEKMTGLKLDKSLTRTDWSRRPLTAAELAYAAADVRHLSEIHPRLRAELSARGRLAWMEEDCARLADPSRYRNPPEDAWRRLKGLPRLGPEMQSVAVALAAWREQVAQERNRPRKWIIDDEALYRIAERRPRSLDALQALQVLPPKTIEKHGATLLALVAAAEGGPVPPAVLELPLSEPEKTRLKQLQDRLRALSEALGIPLSVLAPRADLEALVRYGSEAQVTVLQGWRHEVVGRALLDAA